VVGSNSVSATCRVFSTRSGRLKRCILVWQEPDARGTEAILEFLETTDVGRKAREDEWERASIGSAEAQEKLVEAEEELVEMEGDGVMRGVR